MLNKLKYLFLNTEVLKSMTVKNVKTKYTGSFLGLWWSILIPLLIMTAITFVFSVVWPMDIKLFSLFVLCAIMPWTFFASALSESTNSLIENSALLNQFIVPKEVIPLSVVLSNFINFLFGFLCMLPFFIIFKLCNPVHLILLPVVVLEQLLFVCGVALFFSSINVYVRDINHILGTFLMFWFWVTPIFYSYNMIPSNWQRFMFANPMAAYITMYRDILYSGIVPGYIFMLLGLFWAIIAIVVGYLVFIRLEDNFIKKL